MKPSVNQPRQCLLNRKKTRQPKLVNKTKFLEAISREVGKDTRFLFHLLIPLGILALYLVAFSWLIPEGVNSAFTSRFGLYVIPIAIVLTLVFLASARLGGSKPSAIRTSQSAFLKADFALLLLPLAPVLQYVLNNQNLLTPAESSIVLLAFTV